MLHNIDENGTIQWHCTRVASCSYHNCQDWDQGIHCIHHGVTQRNQPSGKTHVICKSFHSMGGICTIMWAKANAHFP